MNAPGPWEIVFLLFLALLIFGPDKLPKLARTAGQTIAALKREASGTLDELKRAADLEDLGEIREVAGELRSATGQLRESARLTGPVASDAKPTKPRNAAMSTVSAELPPPFDPEAP
ncbi:MAG: twin-arginine translocase TatA/TatE family subunit [Egibacteraceae bacterium]